MALAVGNVHDQEAVMGRLDRRQVIAGAVGAAGLGAARAQGLGARQLATPSTPPETCLTLETFPALTGEHPHDVAPAAFDQQIWYTAQAAGALGLFDPETGEIETIFPGVGSAPHGAIVGPDGTAWVTDGGLNAIVRVENETHTLSQYPVPRANTNLNTAVLDPHGVVWFTG
jgi:virginiamycin B lyase